MTHQLAEAKHRFVYASVRLEHWLHLIRKGEPYDPDVVEHAFIDGEVALKALYRAEEEARKQVAA